jgi:hypothetical protein
MSVRKSIQSIFLLQFPSLNFFGVLGRFHKFRVYVVMISDDKIYKENRAIRTHSLPRHIEVDTTLGTLLCL